VFHQLTERCCTRRHRTVLRAPVSGKNERRRRRGLMPATWREHVSALPAAAAASGASRKPGLLSRSPSHSSNAHLTPSWERAESQAMPSQRGIRRQGPSRKPAEAPCSLRVEHGSGGTDSGCWLHEPTGDPCPGAMASPTREPRGAACDRSRGRPHGAGPSGLRTARATQSGTSWLACRPQCAHQQNVVRVTAQLQRRRRPADGDLRLTSDAPAVRERRATPTTAPSQRPRMSGRSARPAACSTTPRFLALFRLDVARAPRS
jgi:hypothetical protein